MVLMADKKQGRPKVDERKPRTGRPYHIRLPLDIAAAFEQSRAEARRTKKAQLEAILEEWLREKGFMNQ